MALYLAREFDARVIRLTLSVEQLEAREDRVRFELMDYRDWKKPVDRVVSVGMFEHVKINHFKTFFDTVRGMLKRTEWR